MINKLLFDCFVGHPSAATKGAGLIMKQYKRFGLTCAQDVRDTKDEFKRQFPGVISQSRKQKQHEAYRKPEYLEHVKSSYIPKIFLFDIETAPMMAYVWQRWKQNVSLDQTVSEWFMICWSGKWLFSSETVGDVLTPDEAIRQDDSRVTQSLWNYFNEADIVIAYNGLNFDVPKANTRFLAAGLNPPAPYHVIDPMKTLKKKFGFSSNKLDSLAMFFGIDTKLHTDFNLWKGCMQGDLESLNYMFTYNQKDVLILEEVFLKLLPWLNCMPNISNIVEKDVCPFCGSEHEGIELDKKYFTGLNSYLLYRCPDCGAVYRSRKATHDFAPTKSTLVNH